MQQRMANGREDKYTCSYITNSVEGRERGEREGEKGGERERRGREREKICHIIMSDYIEGVWSHIISSI